MGMKSIYDVDLSSADGNPNFLEQYKGKVTMVVNTTVGCGNANQMEVLQWLQEKYQDQGFEIIAIPTNDYCGPGVTKGKWSEGITCGLDSQNYGQEVYGTTFKFSEMVTSNPNKHANELSEHKGNTQVNGLGQPRKATHELYEQIKTHMGLVKEKNKELGILNLKEYYSFWLNRGFDNGGEQGGNFEKYLVDKDGYAAKHYQCTVLNYDSEKTVKEVAEKEGNPIDVGLGRSLKVFEEEYQVICKHIEELLAGKKSVINPEYS
jgi:glutathione peroxidase-family protein